MKAIEKAVEALLNGSRVYPFTPGKYTVRDKRGNAIVRLIGKDAHTILDLCKKIKKKQFVYWVIERSSLRQSHRNGLAYKAYKARMKKQSLLCQSCPPLQVIKYTQPTN
jgi:hypothetical protein